ncbi:MAG: response regulator [Lachnospiraceae bacterium]|nr:response regulator [Lachnospiraceae bacterium]
MDKKVLIIGQAGFMMNAIVNGIKKAEYEVEKAQAKIDVLDKMGTVPRLMILYLDSDNTSDSRFLTYLKDLVFENEISLFLVGEPAEVEEVKGIVPEEAIHKVMLRPLNVNDLVSELDEAIRQGTEAEARKKILIVDDDPTMLRMIKSLLCEKYLVYVAGSGMNAITFLATNKVDLILLDYEMPVISGAKVLEMIRSEVSTQDIPVMFLTAKNDKESVMQVLALKPEKYLLKTMPPEEWLQNIDEFFSR